MQHAAHAAQRGPELVEQGVGVGPHSSATVCPRKQVSAAARTRNAARLLERLQQRQPLAGDGRAEHAGGAGQHGGHAGGGERLADQRALVVGAHQHGDVAGHHRRAVDRGLARQQRGDVGRRVARDELAGRADDGEVAARRAGEPGAGRHAQPERRVDRRAAQPLPGCADSTGCTTIRGSPSAAPPNTVSSASSRAASLRQLRASVAWWSAASAASR